MPRKRVTGQTGTVRERLRVADVSEAASSVVSAISETKRAVESLSRIYAILKEAGVTEGVKDLVNDVQEKLDAARRFVSFKELN